MTDFHRPLTAWGWPTFVACLFLGLTQRVDAADSPTAKMALAFKPLQSDIEYDIPEAAQVEKCQIKVERRGKSSGWVVTGPTGIVLRRFVDSNGDNVVDQWRYYSRGNEVYRDLDTNANNKVDQFRWMNTAGTRWGIDKNEDGKIDEWKTISPEEASREAVQALVTGDLTRLNLVLLTRDDLEKAGLQGKLLDKVLAQVADPATKLQKTKSGSLVTSKTKWMRFDSPMPSLVPADQDDLTQDVLVYENAMAIVDHAGKTGFVQLGELIRVGDAWKLTRVPEAIEGNSVNTSESGLFSNSMDVARTSPDSPNPSSENNPELQKLVEQLQTLDKSAPTETAGKAEQSRFADERMALLEKIAEVTKTDEERDQWLRQLVDAITSAIQRGTTNDGFARLNRLESQLRQSNSKSRVLGYIAYQRLLAEYTQKLKEADGSKQGAITDKFLKDLEQFIKTYPQGDDTPQACLQLAVTHEFSGKQKEALDWYRVLVSRYGDSDEGKKGRGALARLDLKGKPLELRGQGLDAGTVDVQQLRGKVVLVLFWATWCKPCTEDLPQIRAYYDQYHDRGFEIVGVNLDSTKEGVADFLKENKVTWPQIHEPGGMESPPALSFGIITVPTMFLVDKQGKVVHRNASANDLKSFIPDLIKR